MRVGTIQRSQTEFVCCLRKEIDERESVPSRLLSLFFSFSYDKIIGGSRQPDKPNRVRQHSLSVIAVASDGR